MGLKEKVGLKEPQARRTSEAVPSPSAVGGAIIGGIAVGKIFGPLGAIAGCLVGAVVGQVLDRLDGSDHQWPEGRKST